MFKIVCVTILALMFVGYAQQSPLPQGGGADGNVGGSFQMGGGAGAGGAGQPGAGANGGAGFSMGAGAQGGAGAGGKK